MLSLGRVVAAQGNDSILFPPAPPTSDQDPGTVNPFADNLSVNLTCAAGTRTFYDINNQAAFDRSSNQTYEYTPGTPIALTATSTLRAVCYDEVNLIDGESKVATWQYNRDVKPTVQFTSPANGQVYHVGNTVSITSAVSDPDGPAPINVTYYRAAAGGATWQTLGQGSGPNYQFDQAIPEGTAAGTYTLRAIATDGRGLTDNTDITITIANANQAPVAHAGADAQIILPTNSVQLNGSTSTDPDDPNGTLTYEWTGAGATFTGAATATPTAQFAGTGNYTLTLKVTDQGSPPLSSTDQVVVSVYSKPAITSPIAATGTAGVAFSYTMTASGFPAPTLSTTGLPSWLAFNAGTGVLSGTPPAVGNFPVTLTALSSGGSDSKTLTITVLSKPLITSPITASGSTGTAFSYTLTATGTPTPTLGMAAGGPAWLSLNAATGALTGTPPAAGTYTVTLTATNSQGSDSKNLGITITDALAKPIITSPTAASGSAGQAFSYTITASGNPAPTFTVAQNPGWLQFNAATGVLSGNLPGSGTFNVNMTATNTQGNDQKTLTITVLTKPAITSPLAASGPVGQAFSYTLTASGTPVPTLAATGLPPWLSFKPATGALTGTPSATGIFQITLTASNSQGTDSKSLTLTIGQPLSTPAITSPLTASGTSGAAFSYTITATGNPSPGFGLGAGGPAWLSVNSTTGVLSGTPPVAGDFTVKLIATNSQGSDNKDLKISIGAALAPPLINPVNTNPVLASGTAKVLFSYTVTATGNPTPTLSATGLPAWLAFNAGNGVLSGTPPAKGDFTVNLTATNGQGSGDAKTLKISVSDSTVKPSLTNPNTNPTNAPAKTGSTFAYSITATGTSPIGYTTSALPAGITLSGFVISGSPTVTGTFPVTVTATNAYGSDAKVLNITVTADPKITVDLDTGITVFDKSKVVFSVTATGFPAVTYQWQYSSTAAGAFANTGPNSATYTIDSVTASSAGYYRVIVKNGAGPDATSRVRHLIVKPLPVPIRIATQPVATTALVGEKVKIVSRATGEPPLLYQWFKGSASVTPAPKVDDSVFTIAAAVVGDGGQYRARVTNSYTDDTKPATFAFSDSAKLTVQEPKLLKPVAKPAGGAFYPSTMVVLSNDTAGTSIYYTLNGDDPVQTSAKFNAGDTIRISETTTVKARAYKDKFRSSDIMIETYTYTVPGKVVKPVIKPLVPTFQNSLVCSLSTTTPGADIYYTSDGSSPLIGSPAKASGSFTITATTTITAVGRKSGMLDSDTLKMIYTLEKNPSKVLPPKISPPGGPISSPISVTLSSPADTAATIWYTLDGTPPDTSSTHIKYAGTPITVSKTTIVKEVAVRTGFLPSDVVSETYKLVPGAITAQPPPFVFDSVVTVKLSALPANAEIRYILDGTPTLTSPVFPSEGLVLKTTNTISAISVIDGISSAVYSFGYTLKGGQLSTPTPTTTNNQTTFKDSLRIWLMAPTPDAEMYYTLNGNLPTTRSDKYTGPILIDTTSTLQAIAVQTGFDNSRLLVATYTLVPETPVISPPGGSSPTTVFAKITCTSKRASLFYTLDGNDPAPDNWLSYSRKDSIAIPVNMTLKAVAVAGNVSSSIREETYAIFGNIEFVLLPGVTTPLPGGYTLRTPEDQSAKVLARLAGAGPLHLVGFDGVQYGLTLALDASQAHTAAEFPGVTFTSPSSDKRSMYKIDPSGKVYFVSSADTVTLSQAGTYFMGIDIAPPVITYISESFDEKDSTRVSFHIEDNIANLSFDIKRNDDPTRNTSQASIFSGTDLSVKLKHPPGTLKPLYVQVIVSDYQQAAFFPSDAGTMLSLSQRMGSIKGPPAWTIGSPNSPYDFISIPLALDPPLTLKKLRDANPGAIIEGAGWNDIDGVYQPLAASITLQPGHGYWLGSRTPVSSFSIPSATTLPSGLETFSVVLHHGWNQIGNPHLEELYWPYSRNLGEIYKSFPIKGLWEYSAAVANYVETESLKPWRGYYVYNHLEDTVIALAPRPISVLAMKKEGAVNRIQLSMGWGMSRILRLGADWTSSEGLGVEDEFSLPQRNKGLFMAAMRQGRALSSDWVRLDQNGIQEWKVAMGGTGDSLPPLKVLAQDLPAGYETWAVSPARAMKFRIESGTEIAASGLAQDTLLIYSGPKEKMAGFSLLKNLAVAAAPLDLRVSARDGGFGMLMTLPSRAKVHAVVWGLDGTRKGDLALGPLSEGFYRFSWASDFRSGGRRLAPGMYFLSLEIQGAGLNTRLTRKIALSN